MVLLMVQKSCTSWYVVYPIIYRIFIHWWCRISEPSTEEVEKSKPIGSYEFNIENHHPFTRSFICLSWRLPRPWFTIRNIKISTFMEPTVNQWQWAGPKWAWNNTMIPSYIWDIFVHQPWIFETPEASSTRITDMFHVMIVLSIFWVSGEFWNFGTPLKIWNGT